LRVGRWGGQRRLQQIYEAVSFRETNEKVELIEKDAERSECSVIVVTLPPFSWRD
jgi:hypothetical protein